MSRTDDVLYTGVTSAAPQTPREVQREEKEKARGKLKPAADVVLDAIDTERNKVTDIRSLVTELTKSPEELSIELKARNLYLSYLNTLEAKVKNILAVKQPRTRKVEDD